MLCAGSLETDARERGLARATGMNGVTNFVRLLLVPLVGLLATAADAPSLAALDRLQPGKWALSSRDADFPARSICLGDPKTLLQVKHPGTCTRFVITNDANTATVSYTCNGSGNGRTTVRVETPRLAQVETQGLEAGTPFHLAIEARHTGECTTLSRR